MGFDNMIEKHVLLNRGTQSFEEFDISVSSFFDSKFGFNKTTELTKLGINRSGRILETMGRALTAENYGFPPLKDQYITGFKGSKYKNAGLVTYGHSVGGGLSTASTFYAEPFNFASLEVLTYGQLNALDKEAVKSLDQIAAVTSMQLLGDPIPYLFLPEKDTELETTTQTSVGWRSYIRCGYYEC